MVRGDAIGTSLFAAVSRTFGVCVRWHSVEEIKGVVELGVHFGEFVVHVLAEDGNILFSCPGSRGQWGCYRGCSRGVSSGGLMGKVWRGGGCDGVVGWLWRMLGRLLVGRGCGLFDCLRVGGWWWWLCGGGSRGAIRAVTCRLVVSLHVALSAEHHVGEVDEEAENRCER